VRGTAKDHGNKYNEAIDYYESAIEMDPSYARAYNALAWLLATCPTAEVRDGTKAVEAATKACELTKWNDHSYVSTLAAAYSEVADFASAVKRQENAIKLLAESERLEWQDNYEERIKVYKAGAPYRKGSLWSFTDGKLVAYWKFDQQKTGIVHDSSGNELNGRLIGDARIISDPDRGNVLNLDGDFDYVDFGNDPAFNITGAITISAWIKVHKFDKQWVAIITKGNSAWRLARERDQNSLQFCCGPGASRLVQGRMDVDDGQWHHVVGVYDGTRICLYVDGELDVSASATGSIDTNSEPVYIGENSEAQGRFWDGLIDDVHVYSYALSETEVKELYAGRGPGPNDKPE